MRTQCVELTLHRVMAPWLTLSTRFSRLQRQPLWLRLQLVKFVRGRSSGWNPSGFTGSSSVQGAGDNVLPNEAVDPIELLSSTASKSNGLMAPRPGTAERPRSRISELAGSRPTSAKSSIKARFKYVHRPTRPLIDTQFCRLYRHRTHKHYQTIEHLSRIEWWKNCLIYHMYRFVLTPFIIMIVYF